MNRSSLFTGLLFLGGAGLLVACGDDEDAAREPVSGGTAGAGARAGNTSGGRAGGGGGRQVTGGAAGEAGVAGVSRGGSAGDGGAAGSSAAGDGGTGDGGVAGGGVQSGGAAGDAGDAGTAGTGGTSEPPRWLVYPMYGSGKEQPLYALSTADGAEPLAIAPSVSHFSPPEWRPDGGQFLYVGYHCCGASNGAYAVDVTDEGPGEPRHIHAPLTEGTTVRAALFAHGGDRLIAEFVDASNWARWAVRPTDSAVTDWVTVTPGATWSPLGRIAARSPDGSAVVLVEGSGEDQRVYLVDFDTAAPAAGALVHETSSAGAEITEVLWSPTSDGFVLAGGGAPLWVARDGDPSGALPLSTSEHFAPYLSVSFAPDGSAVLFSAASAAEEVASQGVFVRSLSEAGPSALATVLPPPSGHASSVIAARWVDTERVALVSDARTQDAYELFLGDREGGPLTPLRATPPLDELVTGFEVVESEIVFTTADFEGSFQNLNRVEVGAGASFESSAVTRFAPGALAWAALLAARSSELVFVTQEADPESGDLASSRLYHLSLTAPESEPVDITGNLTVAAAATGDLAWSSDGRFLAYSGDFEGDGYTDIVWLEIAAGTPGPPRKVATGFESNTIGPLAWQP